MKTVFVIALATAMARPLAAQAAPAPPFTTTGAFIGLSVADAATSARWYQEKLGLRVIFRPPATAEATAIVLEGGGLTVELMQHSAAKPLRTVAPAVTANYLVHGVFKAGLFVTDFDRTIAELRARGVEIAIGPFPKTDAQPANAIIRDNAGNFIQFFGR